MTWNIFFPFLLLLLLLLPHISEMNVSDNFECTCLRLAMEASTWFFNEQLTSRLTYFQIVKTDNKQICNEARSSFFLPPSFSCNSVWTNYVLSNSNRRDLPNDSCETVAHWSFKQFEAERMFVVATNMEWNERLETAGLQKLWSLPISIDV